MELDDGDDRSRSGSGAARQYGRFLIAGLTTALVYLGGTLLLSGPLGLNIQLSIPLAYAASLAVHFSLQRYFVFTSQEQFKLAFHQQAGRYLGIAAAQYAATALATAKLPAALGVTSQEAYLLAAVGASAASFLLLRGLVFHDERSTP